MHDLLIVIDDLAGRGRRLRGILPGDMLPVGSISPTSDWQEEVQALFSDTQTDSGEKVSHE